MGAGLGLVAEYGESHMGKVVIDLRLHLPEEELVDLRDEIAAAAPDIDVTIHEGWEWPVELREAISPTDFITIGIGLAGVGLQVIEAIRRTRRRRKQEGKPLPRIKVVEWDGKNLRTLEFFDDDD
jgi:hypothetical protein